MIKKTKKLLSLNLLLLLGVSTLNAATLNIKLPDVPEVPKVEAKVPRVEAIVPNLSLEICNSQKTNAEIIEDCTKEKKIIFSDHVAPEFKEIKDKVTKVVQVGDIHNGKVAAYLHLPLMSVEDVSKKLKDAGFDIVQTYKVDKKGLATSIVFTNKDLIKAASSPSRGFASSLRVTIDKKDSLVSITNPIYMMGAFMQGQYDKTLANKTLESLRTAFSGMKNSDEMQKFRLLERYQFMAGMPKYQDMQVLKEATNAEILAKIRKSKKFLYEIKLDNGSSVVGVKLSKRTSKFVKKIGYKNAGLLPYPVLIENGKVKILDPKYYIAIMYPLLKMSQFMTIATIPGAINKDVDKAFR